MHNLLVTTNLRMSIRLIELLNTRLELALAIRAGNESFPNDFRKIQNRFLSVLKAVGTKLRSFSIFLSLGVIPDVAVIIKSNMVQSVVYLFLIPVLYMIQSALLFFDLVSEFVHAKFSGGELVK